MRKYLLLFIFFLIGTLGYSQNDAELKRLAKEFFAYNRYEDALTTLQSSRSMVRNDEEGKFLIALCYYHLNRLDESAEILNNLVANERTLYPECWFYLGKIYHARHQFTEAGRFFKVYLKNVSPNDPNRRMVVDIIRRCANGQQYQFKPAEAFVENLGNQVNTKHDEFGPVLSPNYEDRLYFSSAREGSMGGKRNAQGQPDERTGAYFSDMYIASIVRGIWGGVTAMPYQMNSPRHEQILDFNKDGTALIYFKGLESNRGEILVDTFQQKEERTLRTDPFISPIDARNGDGSPFFYNDTLILFASRRPGGYGGMDLYKISKREGRWTAPQNLGNEINTPYDETSPFLARDGKTLYFSSNNADRSIGGLDVFRSVYIADLNIWTQPQNMGIPINSAADDDHFRLARDGFTGFFDSSRKDGYGQRDLYIAYFNNYLNEMEPPALVYQPSPQAEIIADSEPVRNPPTNTTATPNYTQVAPRATAEPEAPSQPATNLLFFDNATDLNNPESSRLIGKISELLLGNPDKHLVVTAYSLNSRSGSSGLYQAITSAERAAALFTRKGIPESAIFMRAALAEEATDGNNFGFAMTFDVNGVEEFDIKGTPAKSFDPMLQRDLVYKVQIASSRSGNYNSKLLFDYPHPMVEKTLDFEYYRYTAGAVTTYAEAEKLRRDVVAKGISGAYIAPYVYGRRIDYKEAVKYVSTFPDLKNLRR